MNSSKRQPRPILKAYYKKDCLEVGVDEAGRGPLFGRVYVGAAILPPEDFDHSLMRDSKKLSEKKRLEAYNYIKENGPPKSEKWVKSITSQILSALVYLHEERKIIH